VRSVKERNDLQILLHLGIIKATTNQALAGTHGISGVCDSLRQKQETKDVNQQKRQGKQE
jgi:hypothetical protein